MGPPPRNGEGTAWGGCQPIQGAGPRTTDSGWSRLGYMPRYPGKSVVMAPAPRNEHATADAMGGKLHGG